MGRAVMHGTRSSSRWRRCRRSAAAFGLPGRLLVVAVIAALWPLPSAAQIRQGPGPAVRTPVRAPAQTAAPAKTPASAKAPAPRSEKPPIKFYLAQGGADACGPGCSEWIAAEGYIDARSLPRFQAFLKGLGGRKPPVFFQSQGGLLHQAIAIGRLMRVRGMTAGVGRTVPEGCAARSGRAGDKGHGTPASPECEALKRPGKPVPSALESIASCASACVYALFGGKIRLVPPGARLGVHSGRLVIVHSDGRVEVSHRGKSTEAVPLTADLKARLRTYVRDMGIDLAVMSVADKTPFEEIRWLTREEIARFGIDASAFEEARWTTMAAPSKPPWVIKAVLEAKGRSRTEYRASVIQLACAGPQRLRVAYFRALGANESAMPAPRISLASEGSTVLLTGPAGRTRLVWIDAGASFDVYRANSTIEFFEAVAARGAIDVYETDAWNVTVAQKTRLSTSGLAQAIDGLRKSCGTGP